MMDLTNDDLSTVFRSYDVDGDGAISRDDMAASLRDLASKRKLDLPKEKIYAMTEAIFQSAQITNSENGSPASALSLAEWSQLSRSAFARTTSIAEFSKIDNGSKTSVRKALNVVFSYRQQITWLIIFYVFQIMLFGVGIDRYMGALPTSPYPFDAKSMVALSFGLILQVDCGIFLLFPAMRWTFGHLRRTPLAKFLPFDSGVSAHILIGSTVCFCAAMHVILFVTHFYEQSLDEGTIRMNITFAQLIGSSGLLGSDYLGFTAISGWIIVSCLSIMAFFALPPIRNSCCYDIFYWTHKLQYVMWASLVVHTPHFWKFLVGPFIILLLEKLHKYFNAFRWSNTTRIIEVNLLPTNVTQLVIRRPKTFKYNPGDYVFLKVPCLGVLSWHPFTLSSCPEQTDVLWFHIKASGNWTRELREHFRHH